MRTAALAIVLSLSVVGAASCLPKKDGEIVTCSTQYLCGTDDATDGAPEKFCTDPDDAARAAQIAAYKKEFADNCFGAPLTCNGGVHNGEAATCVAQCVAKGVCDIDTAVSVRH